MQGLQQGHRIGFNNIQVRLRSARSNHQSVVHHPGMLSKYIDEELQKG